MKPFIVLYREEGELLPFTCEADDADHAKEQCENAYPGLEIAWVGEGTIPQIAKDVRHGFVICMDTICQGVTIDWITNEDGSESPDVFTDAREAARDILEQRVNFLRSRMENLDDIGPADIEDANIEATDDVDLWIAPITIVGRDGDAQATMPGWDEPETLSEMSRRCGRGDVIVRWPIPA